MELPELGLAVRMRLLEGSRREPVQAQDVDRAQTHRLPSPGWVGEQLLQTWSQATVGHVGPPRGYLSLWGLLHCLIAPSRQLTCELLREWLQPETWVTLVPGSTHRAKI